MRIYAQLRPPDVVRQIDVYNTLTVRIKHARELKYTLSGKLFHVNNTLTKKTSVALLQYSASCIACRSIPRQ